MHELSFTELRVVGCLIEKAATTPDQYPLSLNSLLLACNQKSNRDPVLELDESQVQSAVDSLIAGNLIAEVRTGSRVAKYQHRFGTSEFAEVRYNLRELAVLCLLFLRGPQTAGELRTRAARLAQFNDVAEVERTLEGLAGEGLAGHASGPFVKKLAREPGKRESRWAHLFSGDVLEPAHAQPEVISSGGLTLPSRVELLEDEVATLKAAYAELKAQFDDLMS